MTTEVTVEDASAGRATSSKEKDLTWVYPVTNVRGPRSSVNHISPNNKRKEFQDKYLMLGTAF